jgi:RimJ/RimL family protein N-acetyltransferase
VRAPEKTPLEGRFVRLEPLELAHAGELETIAGDEEIWRYKVRDFGPWLEWVRAWIVSALEAHARADVVYVVRRRSDGALVGATRYMNIAPAHDRLEIGDTWYAQDARGTVVNPECKLLLMARAFDELGAERVELKCDARNARSRRAIGKLGAKEEGTLRRHLRLESGFLRDTVYFSVLGQEWPDVRAGLERRLPL